VQPDRAEYSRRARIDTGRFFADQLTNILVLRIFGWKASRDRFMTGDDRGWVQRERFQPTKSVDTAFRLLIAVKPIDYKLEGSASGPCWVRVRAPGGSGEATSPSMPLAICLAIARAIGVDVEGLG
jgi:hypothetical protein